MKDKIWASKRLGSGYPLIGTEIRKAMPWNATLASAVSGDKAPFMQQKDHLFLRTRTHCEYSQVCLLLVILYFFILCVLGF